MQDELFGIRIIEDPQQLPSIIKFVHPGGREDVFTTEGEQIIEEEPSNKSKESR